MKPPGYTPLAMAVLFASLAAPIRAQRTPVGQRVFRPVISPGETADDLPLPEGAYRIADGVSGPMPLAKVEPAWSPEAKIARLEGTAVVTGIIDAVGIPHDMRVTRSVGLGLDEKALAAIARWKFVPATYGDRRLPVFTSVAVDFRLPAGASRWHLTDVQFHLPEGSSRPAFKSALYPAGAGISPDAVEEGQVLGAAGRAAVAVIDFDIDERGVPAHFQIADASADVWGSEAIRVLRAWRFKPASRDGHAISVPATFTLAWGPRELRASPEARMPYLGNIMPTPTDLHPPVISSIAPEYPPEAALAGVEGTVVLSFFVDESGMPKDLHVAEPVGHGLDEAAIAAVSQWKFRPIFVNGRAETVPATVRVDFYPTRPRK